MNRVLHLIEQFGKSRLPSRTGPLTLPAGQPCMLSFDFIDESPEQEVSEELAEHFSGSLGRTAECISSRSLTDPHCLEEISIHKEARISSLHRAISHGSTAEEIAPSHRKNTCKNRPVQKVRASALLEASELIAIPSKYRSREHVEPAWVSTTGKQLSLDLLRKLGERSNHEELLEKVRVACEKVRADALYNQPIKMEPGVKRRHRIQIKIG